jgi:hypothetical protein
MAPLSRLHPRMHASAYTLIQSLGLLRLKQVGWLIYPWETRWFELHFRHETRVSWHQSCIAVILRNTWMCHYHPLQSKPDLLFFSKSRSIKKDAVTLLFPPVTHGRDQVRFENNSLFLMNAEEIKRVNECHNDIALGSDQNTWRTMHALYVPIF